MMKIGILTFHRAYNYGAILQAYALQKKLDELGACSEIIDYLSMEKSNQAKLFSYNNKFGLKDNISKFIKDVYRVRKNRLFEQFMKEEMVLSSQKFSTTYELKEVDKKAYYDMYIVGSDQVWNYNNTLKDLNFLLAFVEDDSKKCSYAASFGSAKLDDEMYKVYEKEINKFRVVTVREKSSINEFKFLQEKQAKVVLDPSLLLDKEIYYSIAKPRIIKKKYVFIYTIAKDRNLRKAAEGYCREKGYILIDSKKSKSFFWNASPRDFLAFIRDAECVFTNSFHGTAFSIVMQKQFYTEVNTRSSLNNRSYELLCELGLSDRDIGVDGYLQSKNIDYSETLVKLQTLKNNSVEIIKELLKKQEKI